jgi:hypothetical protein
MTDSNKAYKVKVLEAGENYVDHIDTLGPVVGIEAAKQAARDAGYTVIDQFDGGGDCVEAFAADGDEPHHLVTVLPTDEDDEDDEDDE